MRDESIAKLLDKYSNSSVVTDQDAGQEQGIFIEQIDEKEDEETQITGDVE